MPRQIFAQVLVYRVVTTGPVENRFLDWSMRTADVNTHPW